MHLKKIVLNIALIVLFAPMSMAQQEPQYTQYLFNAISINPAYAGSREFLVVNLLNRNQWVGVNGAPNTQTFTGHSSIPNTNIGVGFSFVNDKLGFERNVATFADISYTINLNKFDEYRLSFGLKAGFNQYNLDDELLGDPSISDPFLNSINFSLRPNFGFGVYFRGEDYYLGLSAPQMLTDTVNNDSETFNSLQEINYYLNGGYLIELNSKIKIKPAFVMRYSNGAPLSVDLIASTFINEQLWLGASYRFGNSLGAFANFKVFKGVLIGYAYDYVTSDLNNFTSGSHEIFLNFEFNFPRPSCKCKDLYN